MKTTAPYRKSLRNRNLLSLQHAPAGGLLVVMHSANVGITLKLILVSAEQCVLSTQHTAA